MSHEEFLKKQADMSNKELIERATEELSKLCKTGGKSFTMCVPVRVTDTDMIISELIKRYKNKI